MVRRVLTAFFDAHCRRRRPPRRGSGGGGGALGGRRPRRRHVILPQREGAGRCTALSRGSIRRRRCACRCRRISAFAGCCGRPFGAGSRVLSALQRRFPCRGSTAAVRRLNGWQAVGRNGRARAKEWSGRRRDIPCWRRTSSSILYNWAETTEPRRHSCG